MKKILCLFLSTMLCLLYVLPAFALSFSAIGDVFYSRIETISNGFSYTEFYSESEQYGAQHSFAFELGKNTDISVISSFGNSIYGKSTLSSMVSAATEDGFDVYGALNADFFSSVTGIPLGILVKDGNLLASSDSRSAIGFFADGTAIIGYPDTKMDLYTDTGDLINITYFNKYPSKYGLYLLTSEYGESTQSTLPCTEIVIRTDRESFPMMGTVNGIIEEIRYSSTDSVIPDGCVVLCIPEAKMDPSSLHFLKKGERVSFKITCNAEWANVLTAVGGDDIIVSEGKIAADMVNETHESAPHPRLAAGLKANGEIVFFAADGRQDGYSRGMTLTELGEIMIEMGCRTAINLDGGGSLTVMLKEDVADKVTLMNSPSDGSERKISTGLLFVKKKNHSDNDSTKKEAAVIKLFPVSPMILAGSSVTFTAKLYDASFNPLEITLTPDEFRLELSEGIGSIHQGVFAAGDIAGHATLAVSYPIETQNISGITSVSVTDTLDDIQVSPTDIIVKPEDSAQISVSAFYHDIPVHASLSQFSYSFASGNTNKEGTLASGKLGYLASDGMFHAYPEAFGTDILTVRFGDISADINITVNGDSSLPYSDFEEITDSKLSEIFTPVTKIAENSDAVLSLDIASAGYESHNSMRLTYHFSAVDRKQSDRLSAVFRIPIAISSYASAVEIYLNAESGDNPVKGDFFLILQNDAGEKINIPYTPAGEANENGWQKFTASLDGTGDDLYLYAPLSMEYSDSDRAKGTVLLDKITLVGGGSRAFADSSTSWASADIEKLYMLGMSAGSIESGIRYYNPKNKLTRQEFAKMLVSFIGLEYKNYSSISLDFADTSAIAEWALPYVRTAYAAGLMSGRADGDVLTFAPEDPITRQEVMQVFGRLLGDGYEKADLSSYRDAGDIAAWAYDNAAKTVAAGIIGGYGDGTLLPLGLISREEIAAVFVRTNEILN